MPGSGWFAQRKLEAAHLSGESRGSTLKMLPIALPAGYHPSKDPLFKVSEGRPSRSNRTRDAGVTGGLPFVLTDMGK